MKKRWSVLLLALLLAACGNTEENNATPKLEAETIYKNEETFTHNMEGVNLTLDYSVEEVSDNGTKSQNIKPGDYLLEITGTIQNQYEQMIYYSPNFDLETLQQVKVEQLSSSFEKEQILVNPQMKTVFTVVYLLPKQLYVENSALNLRVPAAFKEPNSESSGDALGDMRNWEILIK